jgi:hypothetical protein
LTIGQGILKLDFMLISHLVNDYFDFCLIVARRFNRPPALILNIDKIKEKSQGKRGRLPWLACPLVHLHLERLSRSDTAFMAKSDGEGTEYYFS